MWKKIHTDEQSVLLKIGTIVIEYPVSGSPVEEIDFHDVNNLNSYQVVLVNPMTGEIDLSIPAMSDSSQALMTEGLNAGGLTENPPIIHKFFGDLKEEGVWWIEEEEPGRRQEEEAMDPERSERDAIDNM
ncbi:hypothetical protein V9K67_09355 [Paraflavisolibacter sp. H34]|uniref:hypothetical protein n=1 Tax=Huijunlia imazamoxiresistens TaxID=3127457 RepID=UPI003018111B